jgi:hypothetical protein
VTNLRPQGVAKCLICDLIAVRQKQHPLITLRAECCEIGKGGICGRTTKLRGDEIAKAC